MDEMKQNTFQEISIIQLMLAAFLFIMPDEPRFSTQQQDVRNCPHIEMQR